MPRIATDNQPDDQDVLGVMRRRGCLSLRVICEELWPELRWRPLYGGEDSLAEGMVGGGKTRVLWVWESMGRLMSVGRVQVAGQDPDEVDVLAAVTFELLGTRSEVLPA